MEDCSHATVYRDVRHDTVVCTACRRSSYALFKRWCAACTGWQTMLILLGPNSFACGRCETPLPADAPRRKEIRWA